ncbi:MAG: hypothetical protein ABEI52_04195, partial [Halobacteriaceae archaeon]
TDPITVEGLSIKNIDEWEVDIKVPPQETRTFTEYIKLSALPEGPALGAVRYEIGGESHRVIFHISEEAIVDKEGSPLDSISVTVSDQTRAIAPRGTLVVTLTNTGKTTIENIAVSASGDAINDVMYGGEQEIGVLDPGETADHYVDLNTNADTAEISLNITGQDSVSTMAITGPVVTEEDGWSDEVLDEWEISRDEDTGELPSNPADVSTKQISSSPDLTLS